VVDMGDYAVGRWQCPECNKKHSKPHFALAEQIDYGRRPGEKGRVLFNRRQKDDMLDYSNPIRDDVPSNGEPFDEEGFQRPLYCPHCGFEDEWIIIKRIGDLPGLVEQFLEIMNGKGLSETELLYQFLGWLKGRKRAH